ncbi:hypothetical protein STEG23_004915, partial [Scotinomys teguina]
MHGRILFQFYVTDRSKIVRTWKQPRCPSTEEWISKMWYIYTMEYYAAEKNNDVMKFADKWMELENVILSELILVLSISFARKMYCLWSIKMTRLSPAVVVHAFNPSTQEAK